ncbi:hypothetical protein MPTK1_7g14590 [Marchantia polymorpha subsp. ruderalis]|uniref:Uncharacterized protein n=2 Tax=Marchantia polymorpha TaxID=3197 RepID=A0A176VEU5_MARPO|nr:hypothetical protein AXG93_4273s1200 [Marchantia polymorpha subsp. ruderalis]PTQ47053.1 hypothetical protein MARPO_0009s0144 [Marchantia polymorpha]BBN17447.1 hypothetical protein Mp_7g14590 [Marchantia polymorpha subsp. ruderalis]|eukprot:PTQ47053.1 hypothetical protein MARPO_0009s0144 [Marchantia polymorpha]
MVSRNAITATGLAAFAACGLAFPFFLRVNTSPMIDSSKPLPPQAVMRGPYVNSGSRDAGPDGSRPSPSS